MTGARADILVVDDNRENLRLLVGVLCKQGYNVRPTTDGSLALSSARAQPPDLILLDIRMPGLSGYEVCEQLKADERTREIPVIFISAAGHVMDKLKGFALGGVDYITKPVQVEEVIARVDTHLTLQSLRRQLEVRNAKLQEEIVERGRVEEMLRERTEDLEARNRDLDAFSHTVAHDLRGPLGTVMGYAQLLEADRARLSEETVNRSVTAVLQSSRKMIDIIDALLLLAGLRNLEVEMQPVDLAAAAKEAAQGLGDMIEEYQVEIAMSEDWPWALGYAPWIEEVWVNYLTNALKYGGRPPHVEMGATAQGDGMVRYWVRDNGAGLNQEEQSRLFTPFTRLSQASVKGHGLGLSIVRRIVEKMGGWVGVESEVGRGSTFTFTLPGVDHLPSAPTGRGGTG